VDLYGVLDRNTSQLSDIGAWLAFTTTALLGSLYSIREITPSPSTPV
jgi:hypothetical protein